MCPLCHQQSKIVKHLMCGYVRVIPLWQAMMNGPWNSMNVMHESVVEASSDVVKVFVEATTFSDPEQAFFGCMVMDSDGNFLAARYGPIRCLNDAHLAEVVVVKEVFSWVKDRGYAKVMICLMWLCH
nr:receptor-like protein 12 [Ipomoea batatas]